MSAFVVNRDHIDLLVTGGLLYGRPSDRLRWHFGNPGRVAELNEETADATGAMLLAENVRSVRYRYPDDSRDELPGSFDMFTPYTFRATHDVDRRPALGLLFEALDCYDYQSCESDDWRATEAFAYCEALRDRISREVPGRGDGWDWTRPADWQPSRLISLTSLIPRAPR